MNELKIVRMSSGEELLCELIEETDKNIRIHNVGILLQSDANKLSVIPFIPYGKISENGLELNRSCVCCIMEPILELAKIHEKMFSKIITPPSGIIHT